MQLLNSWGQRGPHRAFRADSTITTINTPQLILPERASTSMLVVQNLSATSMYLEIGSARAVATLTNGAVTGVTITNGGFGFTMAPTVQFLGGAGGTMNVKSSVATAGVPGQDAPGSVTTGRHAKATAVLTAGVVTSITVSDPGAGYQWPPYVLIHNNLSDPFGCANPYFNTTFSGIMLPAGGGSYYVNGTACTTDSLAIACGTAAGAFTVKWMQ